ncbi:MAG: hypothetical protein ACW98X_07960 [Promethearchaeota archaeon]
MSKIEIEETPVKIEISMETQEITKEEKANYKTIHFTLIAFVFFQVLFYFTFSEPLTIFFEGHYLFPIVTDAISRTARFIMIYHSLAVPFLVANTFWIMEYYEIRKKWIPTLKILLLSGAFMVGIAGMIFGFTYIRIFHEIFYFGLFLVFLGGIVFVVAAFPVPNKFAIAALENFTGTVFPPELLIHGKREPVAFLAEAIIRHPHHDVVEDFVVSHLHIQLAQSAGMVLMVGYRTSKISGKAYTGVLLANAIGVIVISYGSWVLDHYTIWVGAGILILCTITMGSFGLRNISKDQLGDKYKSSSLGQKIKGMLRNPILFNYYFLFVMAHLFVTITGIIVGLQVDEFYRIPGTVELEYDFNVGHWHVLSVLIANILMCKAIDYYDVKGLQRKIGGWVFFLGGVLAFGGADIYMLRRVDTAIQPGYTIMLIGVWLLFIAFVWGVVAITKKLLDDRKARKMLLLGDQYEKVLVKEV